MITCFMLVMIDSMKGFHLSSHLLSVYDGDRKAFKLFSNWYQRQLTYISKRCHLEIWRIFVLTFIRICLPVHWRQRYINIRKLFHAKQVFSWITFNLTLRSQLTLRSKTAFTRTWKDILTVNHESRINKSLNHVSREKNSPNHASCKKYRGPSVND